MKVGDWSVDAYVQLFPDQRMLRRWFEIAWQGASDRKIKGFWFQSGQLPLAKAVAISARPVSAKTHGRERTGRPAARHTTAAALTPWSLIEATVGPRFG